MRWIVISLVLFNIMFLLWNWLEYSHSRGLEAMNTGSAGVLSQEMLGAKLTLLRERPTRPILVSGEVKDATTALVAGETAEHTDVAPVATNVEAVESVQYCLLLGPYPESGAAKILLDRLRALQIEGKYAAIEVAGEPDYWVYLRPEPTKELAAVKLKELQEKKIDSFIVPQGEIANGISLGVFDKQENAEKRQREIVEFGYDAQLLVNPRNYMENWVVVYPDNSARFSPELYNQLRLENNKLDLRKEECSKVASLIDIH